MITIKWDYLCGQEAVESIMKDFEGRATTRMVHTEAVKRGIEMNRSNIRRSLNKLTGKGTLIKFACSPQNEFKWVGD